MGTLSKRSKSHHLERAPSRASKSTRFCNMQSSLTRSSFISRQFQSSFCASSKRQSTNKSSSSSSSRKSSFVTKAGADEDELMQKLMAMIDGRALRFERKLDQIVPFEHEDVRLRHRMFLGHREDVLAVTRRIFHVGWVRRRVHEEPNVRRGMLGSDWPHGSGTSRVRPDRDFICGFIGHVFHQS